MVTPHQGTGSRPAQVASEHHKSAVKHVCDMLGEREADAQMCTGFPALAHGCVGEQVRLEGQLRDGGGGRQNEAGKGRGWAGRPVGVPA